jgi:hypothetical protein
VPLSATKRQAEIKVLKASQPQPAEPKLSNNSKRTVKFRH